MITDDLIVKDIIINEDNMTYHRGKIIYWVLFTLITFSPTLSVSNDCGYYEKLHSEDQRCFIQGRLKDVLLARENIKALVQAHNEWVRASKAEEFFLEEIALISGSWKIGPPEMAKLALIYKRAADAFNGTLIKGSAGWIIKTIAEPSISHMHSQIMAQGGYRECWAYQQDVNECLLRYKCGDVGLNLWVHDQNAAMCAQVRCVEQCLRRQGKL